MLDSVVVRGGFGAPFWTGALWISSFFPSPMRDFGYDVADYTGVDPLRMGEERAPQGRPAPGRF